MDFRERKRANEAQIRTEETERVNSICNIKVNDMDKGQREEHTNKHGWTE